MVLGYRHDTRLCFGPHTWRGSVRLGPCHKAAFRFFGASQLSLQPRVAVPGAGGRAILQVAAKQEPTVQQQQQQHDNWLQTCEQVAAFQQQHGRLPRASADALSPLLSGERLLGVWCTEQQRRKAGSKGPPLSAEERAALLAIPGWAWWATTRVGKPWEQRRLEVEAFYQQHGRLPRTAAGQSSPFLPGEETLGRWIDNQRSYFKGTSQPPLSAERVAALTSTPGWSWGERKPWEVSCQQLQEFVRQHARQPRVKAGRSGSELPGEKELGVWVDSQRQNYKAQKLSAGQAATLEATPGCRWEEWSREAWELRLQQVEAFYQQHGRLPRRTAGQRSAIWPGEKALGKWVGRQRSRFRGQRQPPLSAEHIAALEGTPGWSWKHTQLKPWGFSYQQLQNFVQQHGRLPGKAVGSSSHSLPGEEELGRWVGMQRQQYRAQKLSAEQLTALEATPGWWWNKSEKAWKLRLQEVQTFVRQHGRIPRQRGGKRVPLQPQEEQLGRWCSTQRQRQEGSEGKGPLPAEQQAALAAVPGWFWDQPDQWEQRRQKLEAFVGQHGRLPRKKCSSSSPFLPGERGLGPWVATQRVQGKAQKLSSEQIAALEATPGWCWGERSQEAWELRLQETQSFVRQHGRTPTAGGQAHAPPATRGTAGQVV